LGEGPKWAPTKYRKPLAADNLKEKEKKKGEREGEKKELKNVLGRRGNKSAAKHLATQLLGKKRGQNRLVSVKDRRS